MEGLIYSIFAWIIIGLNLIAVVGTAALMGQPRTGYYDEKSFVLTIIIAMMTVGVCGKVLGFWK